MSIGSKIKTLGWYAVRPKYYNELIALLRKRVIGDRYDNTSLQSVEWCRTIAVSTEQAIFQLTGRTDFVPLQVEFAQIFEEAKKAESAAPVKMGGAGNLELVYQLCEHIGAKEVIETGVAYGWSSLAVLLSLQKRQGWLRSVDMPYAKMGNEDFVGTVVPAQLRSQWELIRLPDSKGLKIALSHTKQLDLCHYDSDKSYAGRMFAYPLLWEALRPGGIFMSDDIQDNLGFHDWCKKMKLTPVIVELNDKFIAVVKKPG